VLVIHQHVHPYTSPPHGPRAFLLRIVLWVIDALTSIVLTLPAAYLLTRLRPQDLPLYIALAVAPMFIWQSRLVFFGEIDPRVSWTIFLPGWAMELLLFPAALALLFLLRRSREA
jgi:hypothetical protein